MIESALIALLTSANPDSAFGALVGTKLYPEILPRGTGVAPGGPDYPAATYQVIDGTHGYTHDGPEGVKAFRVQFDCYGRTYADAEALRVALVADLSGYRGLVAGSPPVQIQGAFVDSEIEATERDLEQSGPRIWRRTLDFRIWARG